MRCSNGFERHIIRVIVEKHMEPYHLCKSKESVDLNKEICLRIGQDSRDRMVMPDCGQMVLGTNLRYP